MRTLGNEADRAAHAIDPHPPREPRAICPPTPPPETNGEVVDCETTLIGYQDDDGAVDGNSGTALNMIQDRSLYMTPQGMEKDGLQELRAVLSRDNEKDKTARDNGLEIDTSFDSDVTMPDHSTGDAASMPTPASIAMDGDTADLFCATTLSEPPTSQLEADSRAAGATMPHGSLDQDYKQDNKATATSTESYNLTNHTTSSTASTNLPTTPHFDLSSRRLYPHYPSSFLRPGSKFSGTQQSDRQIYNVDVQILTLSVPESTMTGYLRICGLTEDHPTLTTFFTGEIIGGPSHKHTFQTKDAGWGATDRTDLQHWARFPAWRPLNKDAKRDINFKYPPPATGLGPRPTSPSSYFPAISDDMEGTSDDAENPGWWTQPNVFMRWKEWFLVPDHRVRSIQGASFEGFYYICFNQVEGKINGIYFHARSEKYQQLELKHKFDRGVCGAMEFR